MYQGKRIALYDFTNPDWAPNIKLTATKKRRRTNQDILRDANPGIKDEMVENVVENAEVSAIVDEHKDEIEVENNEVSVKVDEHKDDVEVDNNEEPSPLIVFENGKKIVPNQIVINTTMEVEHLEEMPLSPNIQKQCEIEANIVVKITSQRVLSDPIKPSNQCVELIKQLTSLLFMLRTIEESGDYQFECVENSMQDIISSLNEENISHFHKNIQVNIDYIKSCLDPKIQSTSSTDPP